MKAYKIKDFCYYSPKSNIEASKRIKEGKYLFSTSSDTQSFWIDKVTYDDESLIIGTGGTDNVWFHNMTNDEYILDVKRSAIDNSNIPNIVERFNHLKNDYSRSREDTSFIASVDEIRANDYDLTFNKYKKVVKEEKQYKSSKEIYDELKRNYNESKDLMCLIEKALN